MKRSNIIFLLSVFILFGFCLIHTGKAYAYEWNRRFETDDMYGKISRDGKSCWIQYIDVSRIEYRTLKIPGKVMGATVVRIGYPLDEPWSGFNIFGDSPYRTYLTMSIECEELEKIVIPDSVETIEKDCFVGLINLETIKLPKNLKEIKEKAFAECESIQVLKLPSSVETIGEEAFIRCKWLRIFSMGKKVKQLPDNAFIGCESLEKVSIHKKNKVYGAKNGYVYLKGKKTIQLIYARKKTFTIPKGIKTVSSHCMQSIKVSRVNIPSSVKDIQTDAFSVGRHMKVVVSKKNKTFANLGNHVIRKSDGLLVCMYAYRQQNLKLPKGIKIFREKNMSSIGYPGLVRSVTFPSTLKEAWFSPYPFSTSLYIYPEGHSWDDLEDMHFKGKNPPVFIEGFSFTSNNVHYIYVPKGSKKAYLEALKKKNPDLFQIVIKEEK